ncbi:MAG: replication initiator protein [Microvirus sp.]|nr:MAG: replication initiator protein [Microvirus sp.]
MHEAKHWKYNCFVTLTYDDKYLPNPPHLSKEDWQKFIKRLRWAAQTLDGRILTEGAGNVRYFGCGEYGEQNDRPHYHLLLFNCDFADRVLAANGLHESASLSELWPFGFHKIGSVSGASATYVAQYSLKKQGGRTDCDADGVVRPAAFLRMSLKPAIGAPWLTEFKADLQNGYLVNDAIKSAIPRTYVEMLKKKFPRDAERVLFAKWKRMQSLDVENFSPARLKDAEIIHKAKLEESNRSL